MKKRTKERKEKKDHSVIQRQVKKNTKKKRMTEG